MTCFAMKEFMFLALSHSRRSEIPGVVQFSKRLVPQVAPVLQQGAKASVDLLRGCGSRRSLFYILLESNAYS